MTVSQIRIARPTDRLDEVVRFYRDGLGFAVIGKFEDHDGYDGVMLALPGRRDHLEFTSHRIGSPCPAPTRDNLLVLYLPEVADIAALDAQQPSYFMIGTVDGMMKVRRITEDALRPDLPGLRGFVALDGIGHWPQLEATSAVNDALIGFLESNAIATLQKS